MSDNREKLKAYVEQRVVVRGTLQKWDCNWMRGPRQTGRACIANPEIAGTVMCEHVWVVDVPHWKEHKDAVGSQVKFDAVVTRYYKGSETSYSMTNASELTFLHQPAILIPDLPVVRSFAPPVEIGLAESVPEAKGSSPAERIRQVKSFAKVCGGYEQAEKILLCVPPIPQDELLDFVRAMKD